MTKMGPRLKSKLVGNGSINPGTRETNVKREQVRPAGLAPLTLLIAYWMC
ncbi:hypothetical protein Poly59_45380 [Rubripirellula reticaptiva]|uniref:Uncharacterized protein n=1 Tax=Rubripirellula reticaptiva TaxID=2528013 RepID=A0A5C6EI16_9BACT|nr:hypothetical protein Poly59_45380 [Rubripirellula reticaptiva]